MHLKQKHRPLTPAGIRVKAGALRMRCNRLFEAACGIDLPGVDQESAIEDLKAVAKELSYAARDLHEKLKDYPTS